MAWRSWFVGIAWFVAGDLAVAEAPRDPAPAARTWAERLGWPAGKKVVLFHADDLGMCYEANLSGQRALAGGAYRSGSAMVPCPWFNEMASWCVANPQHDVGLHLALTSEWRYYRWGTIAPREKVPGLLDPFGYMFAEVRSCARSARPEEVAIEIRAQLDRARRLGMKPTHIDTHMGTLYARPDFTRVYLQLAMDEQIPAMVIQLTPRTIAKFQAQGYPFDKNMLRLLNDYKLPMLDDFHSVAPGKTYEEKRQKLFDQLRGLSPGLSEIIYHPCVESDGLKKITNSWQQRVWEDRLFADRAVQRFIKDNDVIVTDWKEMMDRFKKTSARESPRPPVGK